MKPQDMLILAGGRVLQTVGLYKPAPQRRVESFAKQTDPKSMINEADSEMARLFYGHQGRLVDKWNHYLSIYERHLKRFRDDNSRHVRLLEIGVFHGGSLELWRKYFGPSATIFGIDIDSRCGGISNSELNVRIGSQADPEFLRRVVQEMGGLDIVIDDGSHVGSHQRTSFETLFPLLDTRGVYIAEDLAAAYWRFYEGGLRRPGTFIEEIKTLVDDIHAWYYTEKPRYPDAHKNIESIHVYDGIVVIEKGLKERPFHTRVGTPSF